MATDLYQYAVTIGAGVAVSGAIAANNAHLLTIVPPGAWTPANLAVDGSQDGVTWTQLGDQNGALFSFPVTVSRGIHLPPALGLFGWNNLRLRSVVTTDPTTNVNQAAAAALAGVVRRFA